MHTRFGPALDGDAHALNGGPPVTAMLVQSANPATVAPDSGRIRRGLMREEMFLAVHEQFLTDTAMLADIVLPATTFLEHDDIYTSYGHKFFQIGARAIHPARPSEKVSALRREQGQRSSPFIKWKDLIMMVVYGSKERTERAFKILLENTGFKMRQVIFFYPTL